MNGILPIATQKKSDFGTLEPIDSFGLPALAIKT